MVPAALDEARKVRLRQVLFGLHETERGKQILGKLGIDRFEPGDPKRYDVIRDLAAKGQATTTP